MLKQRFLSRLLAPMILLLVLPSGVVAQMADCSSEVARIKRAEEELPRLDVAPPGDRTIVCITLETNLLFAKRLSAHLAQCRDRRCRAATAPGPRPAEIIRHSTTAAAANRPSRDIAAKA